MSAAELPDFASESERLEHLIQACAAADLPLIQAHGAARPNARFGLGFDDTPLSGAARSGSLDALRLVLSLGLADPSAVDRRGRHPLTLAAQLGRAQMIPDLLAACPNPGFDRLGHGPLEAAADANRPECVKALLGAFSPLARDGGGLDALSVACLNGSTEAAEILAPLSDLGRVGPDGRSALDLAIDFCHGACAEVVAPLAPESALRRALARAQKPLSMLDARNPQALQGRQEGARAVEGALAALDARRLHEACLPGAVRGRPRV